MTTSYSYSWPPKVHEPLLPRSGQVCEIPEVDVDMPVSRRNRSPLEKLRVPPLPSGVSSTP